MHIDARTLPDNSVIEGDICIIGAGPAGISIALDWANTPYTVILLEGGGFEADRRAPRTIAATLSRVKQTCGAEIAQLDARCRVYGSITNSSSRS